AVDQYLEMHVRTRREAGRADVPDDLALADFDALAHARCKARHVAVGGLVAVGMANADIVAVFALASGLLDDATACRHDGRAGCTCPVDACVHLRDLQDRVAPYAEAGRDAHVLAAHRPAHQELARGVAVLVIVVDEAIRGAEAIVPVGLPRRGHRRGEQLAQTALDALVLVFDFEEELEAISGADALAEVGLVGMDFEDLQDQVVGYALP